MLDIIISDTLPPGDYTLYNLFAPKGENPLDFPEGHVLSDTILRIEY